MNCDQAKSIPIISHLEKLGYKPQKIVNHKWWYKSPFRDERTASFVVDTNTNLFYDFGEGMGGTLLDFVMRYNNCDISGALEVLGGNGFIRWETIGVVNFEKPPKNYSISKVSSLVNEKLLQYVLARKLSLKMILKYCLEVRFTLNNKELYAVGFKNDLDGFELRNAFLQICLGSKAVSLISNQKQHLVVLESWSDFISYLTLFPEKETSYDFIVLNSVGTLSSTILPSGNSYIFESNTIKYKTISCFLDNDQAGTLATEKLIEAYGDLVIDARHLYAPYKDLNDYLIAHSI